jgi:hypothetical protein
MNERRSFLKKTLAVSGALTFSSCASSQEKTKINRPNPSGVKGYNYTLPAFPKGSKLLFQGDSITDMKWGRNQNFISVLSNTTRMSSRTLKKVSSRLLSKDFKD